jgi:hypothetical protein
MTETEERARRPGVSVVELAAGALAALSSAAVASVIGVEGTIIGAAVGSVVATAGGTWYSWSLERTQERLRDSAQTILIAARSKPKDGRTVAEETAALKAAAAAEGAAGSPEGAGNQVPAAGYGEVADGGSEPRRQLPWRRLAVGVVGAFLIAMAAITIFELATGQPLAATVGNTELKGTSWAPDDKGAVPAPATNSPTPSSPSPGATDDASPTPTGTEEPTASPTGKPTSPTHASESAVPPTPTESAVPAETPNG